MKKNILTKDQGFTLVEILIVIGIIAVLAAIVIVAMNPARLFGKARDTERWTEVNGIANAITQYYADNAGVLPTGIPAVGGTAIEICATTGTACTDPTPDLYDMTTAGVTPNYLPTVPVDPQSTSPNTGYFIIQASSNRVTVTATSTEQQTPDISVTQ